MTDQAPYTKQVRYLFAAGGESWAVTSYDETCIDFEETRKNGQEDTHTYGVAERVDGRWVLDEDTREHVRFYMSDDTIAALEQFFNMNPLPSQDEP